MEGRAAECGLGSDVPALYNGQWDEERSDPNVSSLNQTQRSFSTTTLHIQRLSNAGVRHFSDNITSAALGKDFFSLFPWKPEISPPTL